MKKKLEKRKKKMKEKAERNLKIIDIQNDINKIEKQKNKNEKFEKYIFILIAIEHIISLTLSFLFLIFYSNQVICLVLLIMSGAINYIFNDYYAITTIQYLSLSGFISIIQIFLRILEILYSVYKSGYWIILQISVSVIGITTFILYKCKCLEKILHN